MLAWLLLDKLQKLVIVRQARPLPMWMRTDWLAPHLESKTPIMAVQEEVLRRRGLAARGGKSMCNCRQARDERRCSLHCQNMRSTPHRITVFCAKVCQMPTHSLSSQHLNRDQTRLWRDARDAQMMEPAPSWDLWCHKLEPRRQQKV
jgi:hypothetical protein